MSFVHRFRMPLPAAAVALIAVLGLMLASCGAKPRQATGRLDTPEHHTIRGHDFIEKGNWEEAARSFDLALSLGKDYGPAYAGKAIVVAHGADRRDATADDRKRAYNTADDLLDKADDKAKNDDEKRVYHISAMRVERLTKFRTDYVEQSESHYRKAVDLDPRERDPDPHFFMARVYRDAFKLGQAQDMYRQVLRMNAGRTGQADAELALVQKILRAEPGTRMGQVLAFDNTITRADIAGLFIEELHLDRLYARGNPQRFDTGFRAPTAGQPQFQADRMVKAPEATDIDNHPLRADILEVMKLRVAGLTPDPSHQFHPNATVLRGEFAMMVEDILVKVTGEQGLRTKFFGQPSPFADVRSDAPWFNAIQVVSTRSLMEPVNKVNGVFGPGEPITGADALLVLRLVKDELRSYIR